jgi:hypothetical protein
MIYALTGFGVLAIAAIWFLAYRMRRAGEDSMAAKVTKTTADVLVKQDKAAAGAAKTKDELIERLRKSGF